MFTRTSLQTPPSSRNMVFKYLTMFFLGASCVLLTTQAFNITTNVNNALQYIGKIVITSDGTNQSGTGIILDGSNGNAYFSGTIGINQNLSVTGTTSLKGNVTMGTVAATSGTITKLSATTGTITNLLATNGSITNFTATNGSIGSISLGTQIKVPDIVGADGNPLYILGSNSSFGGQFPEFGNSYNGGDVYITPGTPGGGWRNGNVILANNGGNVGIGTSNPTSALDISGNLTFTGGEAYILTHDNLYLQGGGKSLLLLRSDGNVDVGDDRSSTKLTVKGPIQLTKMAGTCDSSKGGTILYTGDTSLCGGANLTCLIYCKQTGVGAYNWHAFN